ncbi:aspartate carbamoyltransferase regulatory subunit [Porphyromonas sp.]|uniref:aspartate carbamoyltransferase regulatory subunit n=1 Tax=Porphyromonas sp. TaxID=1924944 RepID=UPI0026DB558E|nr:aspartate carbamoyltransferase regulatory subunit [Porphyromonas sp.]MDO4695359.1 aspartate carbamoyltransferase regulatory subunit [Porphyromonas sp.]MDO4770360.1 aspartate carbamoyltransferase regulatory subunit [Porphyromonas sp.]
MPKVEKGALQVPAICNGSVIDHIPVEKVMQVVQLLGIDKLNYPLTIGQNFKSEKLGRKGLIKVESKHFTQDEVNKLALIAPHIVINVIKDYEVVQKIQAVLPDEIVGIVQCSNPKCISNNEPMASSFNVLDRDNGVLQCKYCNRKIERKEVIIPFHE